MLADRANLRSLLSDYNMTAVRALPNHILLTREYYATFHILKKLSVTLFMSLLDSANFLEKECDILETLFLSGLCKSGIHVGPLVILACCSILKISCRARNLTAMEELEPNLGMLLLILGCI